MVTYESLVEEKGYLFGYFFPLIVNAPPSRSLELLISFVIEDRKVILCRSPRHLRIRRVFILIFLLFLFFFSFFVWIAVSFRPGLSHFPLSSLLFFSLVRNRGWAEPHQERRPFPRRGNFVYPKLGQVVDRGFNVGDFCEIWKGGRRLCAHGWLCFVISFRGGRLCVAQCWWWSNRFCATIGWKSCILEMIDIVFDTFFQFIENFIEISFFLSERKKSQVPLMSLENFLNLFFQVINRTKMKIR